jgi:DNA-directed RNA polymerase subunit beta
MMVVLESVFIKQQLLVLSMLKLGHMVDDKMHARSIGPYSLLHNNLLSGSNLEDNVLEMEVWALGLWSIKYTKKS